MTFTNLVIEDMKDRVLATTDITLNFWKRYMDDTCVELPAGQYDTFLGHLNFVEPTIKFTLERKSGGNHHIWMYCLNIILIDPFPPWYFKS